MTDINLSSGDRRVLAVLLSGAKNLSDQTLAKLSYTRGPRIYVLLDKMEDAGLVTGEYDGTEPQYRFYRLTRKGRTWAFDVLGLVPGKGDGRG
jgi:hypothetical protein